MEPIVTDPYFEIVKQRERKKAYWLIAGAGAIIVLLLISLLPAIPEIPGRSYNRAVIYKYALLSVGCCVFVYRIFQLYRNRKSVDFELLGKNELEAAERELEENEEFLNNLSADRPVLSDDDDEYTPRRYVGRRHGVKDRMKFKKE